MKKINTIIKNVTSILLISAFLIFIGLGAFFIVSISNIEVKEIEPLIYPKYSYITDENNTLIEDFKQNDVQYIKINDIPQTIKDALISIEDRDFYLHQGINEKRIFSSLLSNLNVSNNTQGASTITQQLVKNLLLNNKKTYTRKVQEAYLAIKMEQELSKDEILERYFNHIYFDQSVPGIQYASYKFFSKDARLLSLPEAALLIGLVKSPSFYYPINHPDRANERKNEVLKAMLENNKISTYQYNIAKNFNTEDLLNLHSSNNTTYKYQAYLDVVYQEVQNVLGIDVFSYPLKVETYIDTYLQNYIDEIQKGNIIKISNPHQQIGGTIINSNGKIVGIIGGRNYEGKKLYNHGFDMKTSPASTIKPVLSYSLAVEHLHYNSMTTIEDKEYYYPNSSIKVNNADKSYLGRISMLEAIGYSRNTCAVSTLEKVINKIGIQKVKDYLYDINLMDNGDFTYSYAIGGMKYGVSTTSIAGAYFMLMNNGIYKKPTTIKRIIDLNKNKVLYEDQDIEKRIISEESSSIITNTLERIVDKNFLSMSLAKPIKTKIAGKTGTGAYASQVIKKYNYPANADKDIWFSGYSPDYTCAIWSGFDEPKLNEKTYFSGREEGKKVPKIIFKKILDYITNNTKQFNLSKNLTKVYVVKGLEKDYIPNELVPSNYIDFSYYKKEDIPSEILPYPILNKIDNINGILYENTIYFSILNKLEFDNIYSTFFGEKGYLIYVYKDNELLETIFTTNNDFEIDISNNGLLEFVICESFKNNHNLKGDPYRITYYF